MRTIAFNDEHTTIFIINTEYDVERYGAVVTCARLLDLVSRSYRCT